MSKKLISLHGAYHPNNYGDVLILAIQAKWINEILSNHEVVLPYATNVYRDEIKPSTNRGLRGLIDSEKLIYGSGGYLGEPNSGKIRWGFSFFKKHFVPSFIFRLLDKPYAIIGTGVGPITNSLTKYEVKKIANNASVIAIRDEESKEFLEKIGIEESKIHVTVDVALSLKKEDINKEATEKIKKLTSISGILYGIHIGVDRNSKQFGEKVEKIFNDVLRFLNENPDIQPVLIIDNDNSQQNEAVEYLSKKISQKCIVYKHDNIWETTALLSELDFVVTNKLHVGIVSYALGTIPISLPSHQKTVRFYKQINREDLCIRLEDLKDNDLYKMMKKTLNEKWVEKYQDDYSQNHPFLQEKALLNKKILKEFLITNLEKKDEK